MDLDSLKTIAMWVIIGIAVVGVLLAILVQKIIAKVISLALAAVLVFFAWQQRDRVLDTADDLKAKFCAGEDTDELPSFFGIQVSIPDDWCTRD